MQNLIVIKPPSEDFPKQGIARFDITPGVPLELPFELKLVKPKRTDAEKAEHRRLYRKEYVSRPDVRAKILKKMSDPEIQRKRKEYGMREEVKLRKKVLAARTRALKRELKMQNPQLYQDLMSVIATQNLPDPNHYTHRAEDSTQESVQEKVARMSDSELMDPIDFPICGTCS